MPQVFHLGGGSSNFGLDSHLHRVQLGNGSERVVVQMNANGHIEFSNPVTGNAVSFPFETMYGNVGLEMNGVMSSDSYIGVGSAPSGGDETSNTDDSASTPEVSFYPTGMNAADNLSNYPGFTNAMYFSGSDYLSRSATDIGSGGSTTTWALSVWFKLTMLESHTFIYGTSKTAGIEALDYLGGTDTTSGFLRYYTDSGSSIQQSEQLLRDTSSWYHVVAVYDSTNSTESNRMKLYLNGDLVTLQAGAAYPDPSQPSVFNNGSYDSFIGKNQASDHWYGYMANIQFIDGQALDASYFGQYLMDADGNATSAWAPKLFDGTSSTGEADVTNDYGTNGFLLDFSKLGLDSSGNIDKVYDTAPISGSHSAANDWDAH